MLTVLFKWLRCYGLRVLITLVVVATLKFLIDTDTDWLYQFYQKLHWNFGKMIVWRYQTSNKTQNCLEQVTTTPRYRNFSTPKSTPVHMATCCRIHVAGNMYPACILYDVSCYMYLVSCYKILYLAMHVERFGYMLPKVEHVQLSATCSMLQTDTATCIRSVYAL